MILLSFYYLYSYFVFALLLIIFLSFLQKLEDFPILVYIKISVQVFSYTILRILMPAYNESNTAYMLLHSSTKGMKQRAKLSELKAVRTSVNAPFHTN